MTVFYLLSIILFIIAWSVTYPQDALEVIAGLLRQFRKNIIQRIGDQAAQELAQQLRAEARQMGIPTKIANQVIEEHKQEIVDRLGEKYARELMAD